MESNQTKLIDITKYPIAGLLDILLQDKTTKKNIIWATDAYASLGEGYQDKNQMLKETFLKGSALTIRPRIEKAIEEQQERTKKKAEVFTPSWICNEMNNYCDEEWFGRKEVFNVAHDDDSWTIVEDKIQMPEGKTWKEYVLSKRLEITCGEAPFLVSRYDTSTGELIKPPLRRIGILDRKLRIINENANDEKEWLKWVKKAYQSTYGYEYQGDNLLIARSNLYLTFFDYYIDQFGEEPKSKDCKAIAEIIAWNIWQMDGLTDTVPLGKPFVQAEILSGEDILFGNASLDDLGINSKQEPVLCKIKDWESRSIVNFKSCKER